jgi:hypothetical protein
MSRVFRRNVAATRGRMSRPAVIALTAAAMLSFEALVTGAGCVIPISDATAPDASTGTSGSTEGGSSGAAAGGSSGADGGPTCNTCSSAVTAVNVPGSWTSITSNLAGQLGNCASLAGVAVKPDEDLILASVSNASLWGTNNGGASWVMLGDPDGSSEVYNRLTQIVWDPSDTNKWWEVGIYGPSPMLTTDDGITMTNLGGLSATDWISIDFTDPDRKTILAGGHEIDNALYLSTDSGNTWTNIGGSLPAGTNCTQPLLLSPTNFLVGCGGYNPNGPGGPVGIFSSADSGATWTQLSTYGAGSPPLVASDGTIYWVAGDGSLAASHDQGASFTLIAPPKTIAYWSGNISGLTPIELPDQSIAAVGPEAIIVSTDQGKTWREVSPHLPVDLDDAGNVVQMVRGVAYSTMRKEFYIWHTNCSAFSNTIPIPEDGVMKFAYP